MTTVTAIGYPTASAEPRVTSTPFELAGGRVFVVTPADLASVEPSLASDPHKIDPGVAAAMDAGRTVISEYATVATAFERRLLDAGFQPIHKDMIARALSVPEVAVRLQARVAQQGSVSLAELAMEAGPRVDAPYALLVRSSRLGYADHPTAFFPGPALCDPLRIQPLEVLVDVALVRTETGDILWSGEQTLRASDLLPEPITFPRGPNRGPYTREYAPNFVIYGQDDGERCGTTSIGGLFCMEWGSTSGGCQHGVAPAFPEMNAYMIDETVHRLVDAMMRFAHR
jgi:hypothetical protein